MSTLTIIITAATFFLIGAGIIAFGTLVAFGLPEPRNSQVNTQET